MGQRSEVLHCYEQLAPLTEHLLARARCGEWGSLPALEERYSAIVARLREIEPSEPLEASQLVQKRQLLIRIRRNHDEVCRIVGPQLVRLGEALQNMQQQRQLVCYEQ